MNNNIKKNLIIIFYPIVVIRRWYVHFKPWWLAEHFPRMMAAKRYKKSMHGKELDWNNPKDLNEKINWMKFNSDLTEWTRLTDKYRVREYIIERGREDLLVKLYGVWANADEIDFDSLPDRFVLKANNGCATVILVDDKKKLDTQKVRVEMNNWLKKQFGVFTVEPHYKDIKPLLIAEELLENDNLSSTSLVDYKVFCLDGKPYCVMVCANRIIGRRIQLAFYDLQWNPIPDMLAGKHRDDKVSIEKPQCLSELIKAAEDLSKGHPEVRVDFYIVNNKIYFGEMTFTSLGGYMDYISEKYLYEMGALVTLPQAKRA